MAIRNKKYWPLLFVAVPIVLLYFCFKYYCKKKPIVYPTMRQVPEQPIFPPSNLLAPSYSPQSQFSQSSTWIGFGEDVNGAYNSNGHMAPNPHTTPYPPDTNVGSSAPYPLTNSMPQPLGGSSHSVTIYPVPNTSSALVPGSNDLPPSYLEATKNK